MAPQTVLLLCCIVSIKAEFQSLSPNRCQRGQSCWPTPGEISALEKALDPQMSRNLHWAGGMNPRPAPVPIGSKDQQPLYGMNVDMRPLYVKDAGSNCSLPWASDACKAAVRNLPQEGWEPAFVAWPLNAAHVQTCVLFAKRHNLCVAVAGTGHDFLNRHSCNDGMLIRTTMLKEMDWAPRNQPTGAVKLGAGLLFQEIDFAEQGKGVYIATGWAGTVGVLGWSIGGGHGPAGPTAGLGVDNVLEVDIVTASGELITANATQHEDLLWALRGGGGSTWGVITAITVRTHKAPTGGWTFVSKVFGGSMCGDGEKHLNQTVDAYLGWAGNLSARWSGLALYTPVAPKFFGLCQTWSLVIDYAFMGASTDEEFAKVLSKLTAATNGVTVIASSNRTVPNLWENNLPHATDLMTNGILPVPTSAGSTPGTTPSVLVDQPTFIGNELNSKVKAALLGCKSVHFGGSCTSLQFYHDIPGTRSAVAMPPNSTSIHPEFRKAVLHLIVMTKKLEEMDSFYAFGASSYFSESAYNMNGHSWKDRLWGSNYAPLLAVKKKYDPTNLFWCRQCVGSDEASRHAMEPLVV